MPDARVSVLIVGKGHAFDHNAFMAMFGAMPDIVTTFVEHPAAQVVLGSAQMANYHSVLFYDMCGIPGAGLTHDGADESGQPPTGYRDAIEALIERGTGIVMLNHATVSWPNWPLWRRISGTSFMLRQGVLNGIQVPGSGYRGGHGPLPNATVRLRATQVHPVLTGLEAGFEITDELYLKTAAFERDVLPLMRAEYEFVADHFTAPPLAPPAERRSWTHPRGSDLLVWANGCGNSPVVATDLGDGPAAFANPGFRTLIGNALQWTSSAEARSWARSATLR